MLYMYSIHCTGCVLQANTVLFRASTHGHLQLKHHKLGMGSCTEDVLEWFNYSLQAPTSKSKVTHIGPWPMLFFQPNEASPAVEKA